MPNLKQLQTLEAQLEENYNLACDILEGLKQEQRFAIINYKNLTSRLEWRQKQLAAAQERSRIEQVKHDKDADYNNRIWDEYKQKREKLRKKIEKMRKESKSERWKAKTLEKYVREQTEKGRGPEVDPVTRKFANDAERARAKSDELFQQSRDLVDEIVAEREKTEALTRVIHETPLINAINDEGYTATMCTSLELQLNRAKDKSERIAKEIEKAQVKCKQAQIALGRCNTMVENKERRKREYLLNLAGIEGIEREDAVIREDADGTQHIYSGGLDGAFGYGHGHVVIDRYGRVVYRRGAFEEHGWDNYTEIGKAVQIRRQQRYASTQ